MTDSVDLSRLVNSSSVSDNVQVLTRIRDSPSIYTSIATHLHGLFTRSLLNATDAHLRSIASQAFVVLADHVGRIRDVAIITSLFTPLTRCLISCEQDLPSEREDDGSTLLILRALASAIPQAVVPHLSVIITYCHQTVNWTENAPSSRLRALQLLETLSENASDSIPDRSLSEMADSCLLMMTNIEWGAEGWIRGTETNLMKEAKLGKDCLTRIVFNLHERRIAPVVLEQTGQFLLDEDWKSRLAGVMGLEIIGTTGRIVMIDQIANSLSSVLKDPDAIVRGAACQVLSHMSHNYGSNPTFLQDIVPLLVDSMADKSVSRVASKAAEALFCFCKFSPQYIPANLDALLSCIACNFEEIASMQSIDDWRDRLTCSQLNMVIALATASIEVASSAESIVRKLGMKLMPSSLRLTTEEFAVIYDTIIASLKMILKNERYTMVTLNCISRVAIAVGKKKFADDAQVVLTAYSLRLNLSRGKECKSLLVYLRRMVNALADHCPPFLPLFMSPLARTARCPAFVAGSPLEEWKTVELSSHRASVIIDQLATQHTAAFAPYATEVAKVFCNNMRTTNVSMRISILLCCVKQEGMGAMRALWVPFLSALREVIKCEDKKSHFWKLLGNVGNCVEHLGTGGLSTDEVREIGVIVKEMLEKKLEKDADTTIVTPDKRTGKTDELLVQNIATVICSLFEAGANSFQVVHSLVPVILSSMKDKMHEARIMGYYVKNTPQLAHTHHAPISVLLLSSISDDHPDTRMYSSIAIGSLAQSRCLLWTPLIARSIPLLHAAISRPDARINEQCILATEHAISAAAKIIRHREDIDITLLLNSFVDWLNVHGIRSEYEEAEGGTESSTTALPVYALLLDLIHSKHPLIIGENQENWPKIIRILVKALTRDIFGGAEGMAVKRRLMSVIERMGKYAAEPFFMDYVARAGLNGEGTNELNRILSSKPTKDQP